jgi:hypothetical protein
VESFLLNQLLLSIGNVLLADSLSSLEIIGQHSERTRQGRMKREEEGEVGTCRMRLLVLKWISLPEPSLSSSVLWNRKDFEDSQSEAWYHF